MVNEHKHFAVADHNSNLKAAKQFNADARKLTEGAIGLVAVSAALRVI